MDDGFRVLRGRAPGMDTALGVIYRNLVAIYLSICLSMWTPRYAAER